MRSYTHHPPYSVYGEFWRSPTEFSVLILSRSLSDIPWALGDSPVTQFRFLARIESHGEGRHSSALATAGVGRGTIIATRTLVYAPPASRSARRALTLMDVRKPATVACAISTVISSARCGSPSAKPAAKLANARASARVGRPGTTHTAYTASAASNQTWKKTGAVTSFACIACGVRIRY